MKDTRRENSKTPAKTAAPQGQRSGIRYEWPLLIYPVLFLATFAVLCVVNRSIERQVPTVSPAGQTAPEPTTATDRSPQLDTIIPPASGHTVTANPPRVPEAGEEDRGQRTPASLPPKRADETAAAADRSAQAMERKAHLPTLDQLQGPDRIIFLLQTAVDENDHARIKKCLDELVALGDAAVVPLNDLIGTEGEAALWAAEALARIGTPMATSALLDALAQTKEGVYKEELGKRVSNITNHDSWPVLLDSVLQTGDATVVRAAGAALSRMADTPVVDAITAYYESAASEVEVERLTQLVSSIQSPKATEALLALAGDTSSVAQDALQRAAIDALARIGDPQCVSHLLRRLEAASPGEGTEVFNAITRIDSPEAHTPLLYAAAGNKEVSAENGQTAAIYALKNYPSERTLALLEQIIAQEDNDRVRTAATRTLDDLKMAPHAAVAKADPLVKEDHILPPPPEK
jgi:HEAT repeat protein